MKRYIRSSETIGSPLKTYRGSRIARSKYGVGKEIGGSIYVHKQYMTRVVPLDILDEAEEILYDNYPDFEYNCIKWDKNRGSITFQEAPDFDTEREPVVGDYVTVYLDTRKAKFGHSNYIWHHKWTWVENDYTGFDVEDSWNWSKKWLSALQETSDGNGIERWNAQLRRYGLPLDGE